MRLEGWKKGYKVSHKIKNISRGMNGEVIGRERAIGELGKVVQIIILT